MIRTLAIAGAALAALALGVALGSEYFLGKIPCALCLLERWPYRVAIGLGLLATVLPRRVAVAVCWLMVLAYAAAAGAAFVHVGVEQAWWKSPLPECTAPDLRGLSMAERLARMPLTPAKSCEEPEYLVRGLPLTFPQANFVYALAVGGGLAMWLTRKPRSV